MTEKKAVKYHTQNHLSTYCSKNGLFGPSTYCSKNGLFGPIFSKNIVYKGGFSVLHKFRNLILVIFSTENGFANNSVYFDYSILNN